MNEEYLNGLLKAQAEKREFMDTIIRVFQNDNDIAIVGFPDTSLYTYLKIRYKSYQVYIELSPYFPYSRNFKIGDIANMRIYLPENEYTGKNAPQTFLYYEDIDAVGLEKATVQAISMLKQIINRRLEV